MQKAFKYLPIESLQPGQFQPRRDFDKESLHDLAQSIRTQGLIEPLVVREINSEQYEIIAGERRWRAAMLAGLGDIPCLIGEYSDEQTAAISLVENIQRQDLNLLEESRAYLKLQTEFHFNQEEIAALVGKSRSHIANLLRLLTLCEPIQEMIRAKQLSLGHARLLVGLPAEQQKKWAHTVIQEEWSVRRLEKAVHSSKDEHPLPSLATPDRDITFLETQLADHLGTPVQIITHSNQGGWVNIKYFDNDTLTGLLERMGLRYD